MRRLGASSAKRWMTCAASVIWEERLPPSKSSVYADEGSAAHEVAEMCLRTGVDAKEFIGLVVYTGRESGKEWTCDEAMASAVQVYVDFCRPLLSASAVLVEHKFEAGAYYDHLRGAIADCMVYDRETNHLTIVDYKHGQGVAVDAHENHQMMTYAMLAMKHFRISTETTIEMHIIQPRAASGDRHTTYSITGSELAVFVDAQRAQLLVVDKAEAAEDLLGDGLTYHVSGDHCQWCPAKPTCPLLLHQAKYQAPSLIEQGIDHLSQEQLTWLLDNRKNIKAFLDAVEASAMTLMEKGLAIPGYKLVERRSHRRWAYDEAKVLRALRKHGVVKKDLYDSKIKSPAAVAKIIGKDKLGDLAETVVIGHAVAPESDRRKEADLFANFQNLNLETKEN